MKIDIPVIASVDVLLVGSSISGMEKLLIARDAGFCAMLVTRRAYCGEDMAAFYEYDGETPTTFKLSWEQKLINSGIDFLYNTAEVDLLYDDGGRLCGAVVANRSGFQAILAKVVLDGTVNREVLRLEGSLKPFVPGRYLAGCNYLARLTHNCGNAVKLPVEYRFDDKVYSLYRYEEELNLAKDAPEEFAMAEARLKNAAWSPELVAWADSCFFDLPDRASANKDGAQPPERLENAELLAMIRSGVLPRLAALRFADASAAVRGIVRCDRFFRFADRPSIAYELDRLSRFSVSGADVAVVGGGTGGAPAAIAAARAGAKTVCLEKLAELGGVSTCGRITAYWFGNPVGYTNELDKAIGNLGADPRYRVGSGFSRSESKQQYYRRAAVEAGVSLRFNTLAVAVGKEGNTLTGVVASSPFGLEYFQAASMVDATGNADLTAFGGGRTVLGGGEEILAEQGACVATLTPEHGCENSDYQFICEHDVRDVTRAIVMGRGKFAGAFDLSQMTGTRERRRIVGALTLQPEDFYANRTYCDTVTVARSNFDTHGFIVHPMFMLKPTDEKPHFANVPLRALLPETLDGVLATGLGVSAHRDCMPLIRMQPDVQNQGYAAGIASAMAAAAGVPVRRIDVRELQKKLVSVGILEEKALTETDGIPGPDPADGHAFLANVFLAPEKSLAALKKQFSAAPDCFTAALLAFLGADDGAELLEKSLLEEPFDTGWNYRGMGQFGMSVSPVDARIFALSAVRRESPGILKKLSELTAKSEFSHIRAVCVAFIRNPDKKAAAALEKLLASFPERHFSVRDYAAALAMNRGEPHDTTVRNSQLEELYLARALHACDPANAAAVRVLNLYRDGIQAFYTLFAMEAERH